MGWAFLFLIAVMLVWLFIESRRTRMAAIGLISLVGLVVTFFFFYLDAPERREASQHVPGADVSETAKQRAKIERARTVLTPARIAMTSARLEPGQETVWGSDGKSHERLDLYSWTFKAEVKNLSDEFAVRDLYIRLRLFSCPSFFETPASEVVIDQLERRCALIGERTAGFYGLGIQPGSSGSISDAVTFDNQPEPRNWRYWADVSRVDAVIE